MPPGAWPRAPLAKLPGKCRSELEDPAAHGLVGDIDAALSDEVLDVAIAQSEANVKPNRVPDNRCRKVVVAIGDAGHRGTLPRGVDGNQPIAVTTPKAAFVYLYGPSAAGAFTRSRATVARQRLAHLSIAPRFDRKERIGGLEAIDGPPRDRGVARAGWWCAGRASPTRSPRQRGQGTRAGARARGPSRPSSSRTCRISWAARPANRWAS